MAQLRAKLRKGPGQTPVLTRPRGHQVSSSAGPALVNGDDDAADVTGLS